jgi:hypothetical protein
MIDDEKYPHVYAQYYVSTCSPYEYRRMAPNEARSIYEGIADALGMDREEMAIKLADLQLIKMNDFKDRLKVLLQKEIFAS